MLHETYTLEDTIKGEISSYLNDKGGDPADWYVGIAAEPKLKLSTEHKVPGVSEGTGTWGRWNAGSSKVARNILQWCSVEMGIESESRSGRESVPETCSQVFLYRKVDGVTQP